MNSKCNLCPRRCNAKRYNGQIGMCKCGNKIKIALSSIHNYEEPCISGKNGSGTVFFSNCNLKCVYCQNYKISAQGYGKAVEIEELARIFLKQQENGVNNINLVTPTPYVLEIIEAIKIARREGLSIPIIYNSSGYENIETIKMLNGYIDVYMPDIKYINNELAKKYSNADNYFYYAEKAITEMYNQVGMPIFNKDKIMQKGILIRHLVLPNNLKNTFMILDWIKETFGRNIYISIMFQYFPTYKAKEFNEINRKISIDEYNQVIKYINKCGFRKGYIQDLEDNEEKYVPDFID